MADTYLLNPNGASGYQHNNDVSDKNDQQNQLFKALLQQSMQQGTGGNGAMGVAAHALSQYMMMKGMGGGGMGGGMGSDGVFGLSMGAGE